MKRFWFVIALGAVGMLMSCATMIPIGGLYTGAKFPMMVTSNGNTSSKTGEAQCISILTLIAVGDCSIETAKKNGGTSPPSPSCTGCGSASPGRSAAASS